MTAPAVVGSNPTLTVVDWFGFSVIGKVPPEIEKPVPEMVAELTLTGEPPVEVKVSTCVAVVFRLTSPKGMLVALMLRVAAAALSCRAKVLAVLPALAVSVAVCAVLTEATVAEKPVVVAPAATVTDGGTVTEELLLARPTANPPVAAAAFTVTVQASVPDALIDELVQESAVSTGKPVPLNAIAVEAPVEEFLASVSCPVAAPALEGSNCTVRVAV